MMADKTTPGGVLHDPVHGGRLDEPSAVNLDARLREASAQATAMASAAADRAEAAVAEAAGAVPSMAVAASRLGMGEAPEPGLWAVGMTWRGTLVDLDSLGEVGPLREDVDALAASALKLGLGEAPEPGLWAVGVTWRGERVGGGGSQTSATRTASGPRIACYGDSLTQLPGIIRGGGQDTPGTSYPAQLGAILGETVTNRGWSGRNASQIAMHNGATAWALSQAVTVPADTSPVSITTTMDYPADSYSSPILMGGIRGTMRRDTAGVTFTRAVAGTVVQVPQHAPIVADWPAPGAVTIVGMGRNSVGTASLPPAESLGVILSRVQDMVRAASQGVDVPRVLVLDVPPYENQGTGTSGRAPLDALNAALAQTWPQYHITPYAYLRTRKAFEDAGLTPTAQDEADMAKDITPTAFRGDTVHLTTEGNKAVARYIAAALRERRWYA